MYLIGDIGNTETKICLVNNSFKKTKKIFLNTNLINNKYLDKKLSKIFNKDYIFDKIIFCSVVPRAFNFIKKYLVKKIKTKVVEIKELKLSKFINVRANKNQVGSDRIINAIGAINNKDNFIIIDLGTATTFDVINKKDYLGGVIAPGILLSLNSLSNKASLIPKIKFKKSKNIIGKNTNTSINSGFYWGYSGLIKNIINLIMKKTKLKYKIIMTGGLANMFKSSIDHKVDVDKELTLDGILKIIKLLNKNEK